MDVFEEKSHPLTQEEVPDDYYKHGPDRKHSLDTFSVPQLIAQHAVWFIWKGF